MASAPSEATFDGLLSGCAFDGSTTCGERGGSSCSSVEADVPSVLGLLTEYCWALLRVCFGALRSWSGPATVLGACLGHAARCMYSLSALRQDAVLSSYYVVSAWIIMLRPEFSCVNLQDVGRSTCLDERSAGDVSIGTFSQSRTVGT